MKLLLTNQYLKDFLKEVFPGLTKYHALKIGDDLHIRFNWKGGPISLVVYKNKSFFTNCLYQKFIQEMIKKQLRISVLRYDNPDPITLPENYFR